MVDDVLNTAKEKMAKTCSVYERDMQSIRAGRANPQVLDRIMVDYYGTPTPINQVGNISVPEARLMVIAPWEPKMITPIEKAIQTSDLGLNPSNDGKVIRLVFPAVTFFLRIALRLPMKQANLAPRLSRCGMQFPP